jgi:hypothetical protein
MSREFGSYYSGYLHSQIATAAEDLEGGHDDTTRAWAPLMQELYPVMYAICSSEAGDAGEAESIIASTEAIPKLRAELDKLEKRFASYREVARRAVEQAENESR